MIAYINGKIIQKNPDRLVVLVGGIGIEVRAPAGTIDQAPGVGGVVALHTYLHVRQDVLQLYGFDSPASRDLFVKLMSVSGFGAQKALSVLSIFPHDRFETVIRMGDADALTIIPGVGKKGAERLLLEMKDKVDPSIEDVTGLPPDGRFAFNEAAMAMAQLGYSRLEAHEALKKYPFKGEEATVEELLQFAMKQMA
ncbi:MAG: Holliday junction branch migration protein RuvA [Candidatus Anoxymicrobium japonicum]|uniref:Holliday junction branch migration complex subunit RuvA n=1 Tax=Candidatus Anoxymicrobium japonicum TaxID=2013648 RepID=A0A2N3G7Z8_9ACTN|nr:MAG: Holliday junction branch migration protein RuvA [Candidatus Anoxymicrobium japonicum]